MLFCLLTACYIKCPPAARFLSHVYFLMTQQSGRIYETRINLFWKAEVLANNPRLCQRLNVYAQGCLMPALWQWEKKGEMQGFWNEPNAKGPSLRRASSSGSSQDILSTPRKGMLEEGWHFTQNLLFIQGEGQLSDCLHQSGGAITWEKGQKQCSAPGPLPQDWLLTWVDRRCWYAWSHAILPPWTYWEFLTQFSDSHLFPSTEVFTWRLISWMNWTLLCYYWHITF